MHTEDWSDWMDVQTDLSLLVMPFHIVDLSRLIVLSAEAQNSR